MQITCTPAALEQIARRLQPGQQLKLLYDTEGCGCAVNGVPALRPISEPEPGDQLAAGAPQPIWYDPRQAVFFEAQLRIDYKPERHAFTLAGPGQIYSSSMPLLTS